MDMASINSMASSPRTSPTMIRSGRIRVSGRPLFEFLLDTGAIRRQLAGAAPDFKLESGIEPAFGIFSHI